MLPEVARKRPAEVVPQRDRTVVLPRPYATHIITRRTKAEVLAELARLEKKQYVADSSPLARIKGGGWAVKVTLLRPLPGPMPAWAKVCVVLGTVFIGISAVGIGFMFALATLFGAMASVPWKGVAVAAGTVAILLFATRTGRKCCKVVVEVWH